MAVLGTTITIACRRQSTHGPSPSSYCSLSSSQTRLAAGGLRGDVALLLVKGRYAGVRHARNGLGGDFDDALERPLMCPRLVGAAAASLLNDMSVLAAVHDRQTEQRS
jgi:hypothetical protein